MPYQKRTRWNAVIRMYGRPIWLGAYPTREEAEAVEAKERERYHRELEAEGLDTYHRRPRGEHNG